MNIVVNFYILLSDENSIYRNFTRDGSLMVLLCNGVNMHNVIFGHFGRK